MSETTHSLRIARGARARWWLRVLFAVTLLAIVIATTNFRELLQTLRAINVTLAVCGLLAGWVVPTAVAGWRWQATLRYIFRVELPLRDAMRLTWVGGFVGLMVPGNVGPDLYRIGKTATLPGGTAVNVVAIIGEKVIVVATTGFLLIGSAVLLGTHRFSFLISQVSPTASKVLGGCLLICVIGLIVLANSASARTRLVLLISQARGQANLAASWSSAGRTLLESPSSIRVFGVAVFGQLVSAFGGQLALRAVGINLGYLENIFIWSAAFFAFLLPVTIAGVGVREATYIVLLGAFGITRSNALAASLQSVAFSLMVAAIGAAWFLLSRDEVTIATTYIPVRSVIDDSIQ